MIASLYANRLLPCLATSALLHLQILSIEWPISTEPAGTSGVTVQMPRIEARLHQPQHALLMHQEQAVTRQAVTSPDHTKAAPVLAESIPDNDPTLASAMPGYIDFPITPGFMILSLSIDQSGTVESSEVMYSELSRYATRMIELRFAEANYRPAIKNGQPVKGCLVLKIDIAP